MSINRILHDNLGLSKKAPRWVRRILTAEQKGQCVVFCRQFPEKFPEGQSSNYKLILMGDETWLHHHDPLSKA